MVFITGPLYAGKQTFAVAQWGLAAQDFSADPAAPCPAVRDVQELAACAPDLEALADRLSRKALVLATELGGGVGLDGGSVGRQPGVSLPGAGGPGGAGRR